MGIVFSFLAVDEIFRYHEQFTEPVQDLLNTSDTLALRAWVIPYSIATAIVLLIAAPFFRQLDVKHKFFFLLSALLYVFGAAGFEVLGSGYLISNSLETGDGDFLYGLMTSFEEFLEMMGSITLMYALLSLINQRGGFVLKITNR